jgi:hypothetical protein
MSQFAAVTWKVKRGFDEELARLFLAHSMRCPAARRHDQPGAALNEARGDR